MVVVDVGRVHRLLLRLGRGRLEEFKLARRRWAPSSSSPRRTGSSLALGPHGWVDDARFCSGRPRRRAAGGAGAGPWDARAAVVTDPGVELGTEKLFEGVTGHTEDVSKVQDGEPGLAPSPPPLPRHRIRLRPPDAQDISGFLDGQQVRQSLCHSSQPHAYIDNGLGLYTFRVCNH